MLHGDHPAPLPFERSVALMLGVMAGHIRQGAVDFTGMLPRRIAIVADGLNEVVDTARAAADHQNGTVKA